MFLPEKPKIPFGKLSKELQKVLLSVIRSYCRKTNLYNVMAKDGVNKKLVETRIIMLMNEGYCKICRYEDKNIYWLGFWNGITYEPMNIATADTSDWERVFGIQNLSQN